jgi:hypothetical protein
MPPHRCIASDEPLRALDVGKGSRGAIARGNAILS